MVEVENYKKIYDYILGYVNYNEVAFNILLVIDKTRKAFLFESSTRYIDKENNLVTGKKFIEFIARLNTYHNTGLYCRIDTVDKNIPDRVFIYDDRIKNEIESLDVITDERRADYLNFSHAGIPENGKISIAHYFIHDENFITEIFPYDDYKIYEGEINQKFIKYKETYYKIFKSYDGLTLKIENKTYLLDDYINDLSNREYINMFEYKENIADFYNENLLPIIANMINKITNKNNFVKFMKKYQQLLLISIIMMKYNAQVKLSNEQFKVLEESMSLCEPELLSFYEKICNKDGGAYKKYLLDY